MNEGRKEEREKKKEIGEKNTRTLKVLSSLHPRAMAE
jgi:hypothetical protein